MKRTVQTGIALVLCCMLAVFCFACGGNDRGAAPEATPATHEQVATVPSETPEPTAPPTPMPTAAPVWSGETAENFGGGSGSESDPYRITNGAELAFLAARVKKGQNYKNVWFVLTNDIPLNDTSGWTAWGQSAPKNVWIPIGEWTKRPFDGVFDGQGHTISGLFTNTGKNQGLFGYVKDGIICNLNVAESYVGGENSLGGIAGACGGVLSNCRFSGAVSGKDYVGGIAGNNHGLIIHCRNEGTVTGKSSVGGVTGTRGSVVNCYNTGIITGERFTGGVSGSSAYVTGCYNTGAVSGDSIIGGVAGDAMYIRESYNAGPVLAGSSGGAVAGQCGGRLLNCFYLTGTAELPCGYSVYPCTATELTAAQLGDPTRLAVLDFTYQWFIDERYAYDDGFMTSHPLLQAFGDFSTLPGNAAVWDGSVDEIWDGAGTQSEPYRITSAAELAGLACAVNRGESYASVTFLLENDILLNECGSFVGWHHTAETWIPIGTESNPFAGNFDGGGHSVYGLYIRSAGSNQGLFGVVSTYGSIRNLTIANGRIVGNDNVGCFVGQNSGTLENCINTCSAVGHDNVGGVAGWNIGRLVGCRNEGSVLGTDDSAAGISGYNKGVLDGCYNMGSIHGALHVAGVVGLSWGTEKNVGNTGAIFGCTSVGGVIGDSLGSVQNAFNTGTVTGSGTVGGIVALISSVAMLENGYNSGAVSGDSVVGGLAGSAGQIKGCYNVGRVSAAGEYSGSVLGILGDGEIRSCYYLDGTAARSIGTASDKATARSEADRIKRNAPKALGDADMRSAGSFLGWDFETVWMFASDAAYPYPILQSAHALAAQPGADAPTNATVAPAEFWDGSVAASFGGGSGTADDPYLISNGRELAYLARQVNNGESEFEDSHFLLTRDLHLNDTADWLSWDATYARTGAAASVYTWTPIGGVFNRKFGGVFDGNGHGVYGMYVYSEKQYQGLFGETSNDAVIRNLTVAESFIVGQQHVAGLVALNNGTLENCFFSGVVRGKDYVGGLTGLNNGKIESCRNTGSVTGENKPIQGKGNYIGGIAGSSSYFCTLKSCVNSGAVTGVGDYIGGIAGLGEVEACVNTGVVRGGSVVGGVIGTGIAKYCCNTGAVSTDYTQSSPVMGSRVGGIAGQLVNGSVTACYNVGTVSGNHYVGGIAGSSIGCSITECYSTGKLQANSGLGGIVGSDQRGTVENCYYLSGTARGGINGKDASGQAEELKEVRFGQSASFSNWAFDSVWALDAKTSFDDGLSFSHPTLRTISTMTQ